MEYLFDVKRSVGLACKEFLHLYFAEGEMAMRAETFTDFLDRHHVAIHQTCGQIVLDDHQQVSYLHPSF